MMATDSKTRVERATELFCDLCAHTLPGALIMLVILSMIGALR